jgi:two-component system sensor histidine kinase HydH
VRAFRDPEFWIILAAVAVLTGGHYLTSTHDPFWHDIFRRLYYLPILIAGFRYGLRGGLITAAAVSALFIPHVLITRHQLHVQALEARFEIPLYLAVGAVTGILVDRQRRADRALRRAERLKTLGEMAAGMAHEVRNPLAAIRSSAQMLRPGLAEREAALAGLIVEETDRLNRVVEEILSYARPAPLRFERCRFSWLLDAAAELAAPAAAQRRVEIQRRWPEDEPEVFADPDALRRVFLNLILNAVRASSDSGRVVLKVERLARAVRATVRDFGSGIPPDQLARVCEPFFTTRPGGTGLGLAIARRIVAGHHGRLIIANAPDRGVEAAVELPLG